MLFNGHCFSGWASRAYFSDNGSTAIEIAIKMAFRKFSLDHGIHMESAYDSAGKKMDFRVCCFMLSTFIPHFMLVFKLIVIGVIFECL